MQTENEATLVNLFGAIFELEETDKITNLRQLTTKNWDSLATVSLIAGIESEFSIQLESDEYEILTSYRAVRELLTSKGL